MSTYQGDVSLIIADGKLFAAEDKSATYVKALNDSNANANLRQISFDASKVSSIYGNSNTVQPSACAVKMLIKY